MFQKIKDVFLGQSIRAYLGRHSCDASLPIFGKFGCKVDQQYVAIACDDDGFWFVILPWGSTWSGDWTEEEAKAKALAWKDRQFNWRETYEEAAADAIADAKARHEQHMQSPGYAKVYGV